MCDATDAVRLLMLFDISGSLKETDPNARRRDGGLAALSDLQRLLRQPRYGEVRLFVAADSFASDYGESPWVRLTATADSAAAQRLAASVEDVATRVDGGNTDYREALSGALQRFVNEPQSECKRIFWFTDGAHHTDPSVKSVLTDEESGQIDELCAANGAAARLSEAKVEVTAVHLSSPGKGVPETLRRLYGRSSRPCAHPLIGEIVDVSEAGLLADSLSETVVDDAFESIEQPAPPEPCVGVSSSDGSPTCEYAFQIDIQTQSFDLFIHLRDLDEPDSIEILIQRPGSDPSKVDFPEIFAEAELLHRPTFLLTHAPTFNWRKVRAHQAAQASVGSLGSSPVAGWEGEWKVIFRGPERLLARVSPPRIEEEGLPELRAFYERDELRGEVITEHGPFQGHVELSVDAPETNLDRLRVGRTDGYTVMEDLRWSASDIASELMEVPGMVGHLGETRGMVLVQAQLVQNVDWGGESIPWNVPMATESLPIEVTGASGWGDDSPHPFVADVTPNDERWLTPAGSFTVDAGAGSRDGRLELVRVEATAADGRSLELSGIASWRCDVPAGAPDGVVGCPPIPVEVEASDDLVADFVFHFTARVIDAEALLETAEAQGYGDEASRRYSPMPRTGQASGIEIRVSSTSDTRAWFVLLLLTIAMFGLGLRVHSAARVRRWRALGNSQTLVAQVRLDGDELVRTDGQAVTPGPEQMTLAHALTQRRTHASVGPVRLRTEWLTALLGSRPRITATTSQGVCLAAKGRRRNRGIVGTELRDGWAIVKHGEDSRLVIWDLARDPSNAGDGVERAAQAAASACVRSRFLTAGTEVQPREEDGEPGNEGEPPQQPGLDSGRDMDPLSAAPADRPEASSGERIDPLGGEPDDPLV
ncbi:hypothetical protein [Candidatus Poriferisodalis sp.]|uniref:hypothetical protein n=1 Tax=Candidatus Poriferisodalis sp. TaxID=3101277 RepID=UPI003B0262C8